MPEDNAIDAGRLNSAELVDDVVNAAANGALTEIRAEPANGLALALDSFSATCAQHQGGVWLRGCLGAGRREFAVRTGACGRTPRVADGDGVAMLRALADADALRVFAEVVAATGTGLPERRGSTTSIQHVTAHGVSRRTGLPVDLVVVALERLTRAGLAIENGDGGGWRTDFGALRRVAGDQVG